MTEGLRVVEDIFRYGHDDAAIQQETKAIRHAVMTVIPSSALVLSRKPLADVGFAARGELENRRPDTGATVRANLKRAQEGLRVLEELCKTGNPDAGIQFKAIRYRTYELERLIATRSAKELPKGLYLILSEPPAGYEALAEMAVRAEIPLLQLRYKGPDDRRHLEIAGRLKSITAGSSTALIINDRPDIALLAEADGVHLGQHDIDPVQARTLLGPQAILGLSTHNLTQVVAGAGMPLDYIGFGPVFTTASKSEPDPVTGPEQLGRACKASPHPVVAIGGLTAANLETIKDFGCNNAAVISTVSLAADPFTEMDTLNKKFLEQT